MFRKKGGTTAGGFGGFLAEGTEVDGEVRFDDELRIDGRVTGRIISEKGRLTVGDTGAITADIEVGTASIGGTVSGTLTASVKVEIHATGRVYGDIFAPALIIEEGAVFEGRCEMVAHERNERPKEQERAAASAGG